MKMIPEVAGIMVKSRPLTFLAVAFVVGCLIGWWLFGYVIWPVQYVGESYPDELVPPEKKEYIAKLPEEIQNIIILLYFQILEKNLLSQKPRLH